MEVQVGLLESDPKKKPRADAEEKHMCFRRLALRRCTASQNNLRAIKQVLCDSELIRTEKSFSSILTFGSIFFSNSSSKARNNGASSQVSKLYSQPLNWHWWWRFWYKGADKGTIGSSSQVIDLHPGFKRSRTLEILQSSEWSKS